jgi:hypothetical protein
MQVWDNQQATSWFVAILEGEGSFFERPRIQIPNNDVDIITECERFLRSNLVLFETYSVKAGTKTGYKILISKHECYCLFKKIIHRIECRHQEFQRILGASETERNLSDDFQWMIGIWEAEGSFFLSQNHRGNLTPRAELDNTNSRILQKLVVTLKSNQVSWYAKRYFPEERLPYTKILINGFHRLHRFLLLTRNQWRCKRNIQRTELLLKYIQLRLAKGQKSPYSNQEYEIYNQLKILNR